MNMYDSFLSMSSKMLQKIHFFYTFYKLVYALCHDVLLLRYGMIYNMELIYFLLPIQFRVTVSLTVNRLLVCLRAHRVTGKHSLYIHTYGQFRTTI